MSAQGSIKRDKSGRWMFVVDLPSADDKRRQVMRRGFATKSAAIEALDELKASNKAGLFVEPSRLTVGQYLTDTWLPATLTTVRPSTHDTYGRLVRKHLVAELGAVRLQQLDTAMVTTFLGKLSAGGLSPKSVRNIHAVLSKALADAVDMGALARNPATRAKLPRLERQQPRAWSAEQLGRFLRATADDRLAPLWRFFVSTGCRRGEALGLRWDDVDLEAGIVRISHQRVVVGGVVREGAPKTNAGVRSMAIDQATVAALKAWRSVQAQERLVMGAGWPKNGNLVFTHPDGVGLWPQTITARFKAIADELGLPTIGVHGLRHSAATWMISSGVSPKLVSERLGHAHVAITLALYTHVLPTHDRDAADAFGAALEAAQGASPPPVSRLGG